MMETAAWVPEELPASKHARTVQEILLAPPNRAERAQLRRERAEADEQAARIQDAADTAEAAAFRARLNGYPPRDPLAEAAVEPFRDTEALARRRSAIDILKQHGLADVVTGGASGMVFDPNLGGLEAAPDVAQRAAMDREYEFQRGQREADERTRAMADLRSSLRARGQYGRGVSHRSAVPSAEDVYRRACAEIGSPVDDGRPVSFR